MESTDEFTFSSSSEQEIIPSMMTSEYGNLFTLTDLQNSGSYIHISQPQKQIPSQINTEEDALKDLLISWNCEYIFPKCVEECVDIECLKLFKTHHINKLMHGFPLGYSVKFEHKLFEWQKSEASTICSTLSDVFNENSENRRINVKAIIKQTNYGMEIISQYPKDKKMSNTQRNFVVNGIIDFIVSKNMRMSTILAKDIAEQIVDLFVYEDISTYYNKIKGKNVTGKIYQKYFNKTKSLENVGLKKRLKTENNKDEPINKYRKSLVPEENIELHLAALHANECTWSEVEEKWQKTSNYRLSEIQNMEQTSKILEKWHHFSTPLGYKLVLIDFKTMFPLATDMLTFVDKFPGQMLEIYKNKIKESAAKSMIDFLDSEKTTHNGKLLTTFYLLHYVLLPTARTVFTLNEEKKI